MDKLRNGLLLRNPLRIMHHGNMGETLNNSFGIILARAGIGKTALAVQLAIDSILQNKTVLHVSLSEPIDKVNLWYEEILNNLVELHKLNRVSKIWETIEFNRFIMTFKVEKFSVPILEERLGDLTGQRIFNPDIAVIDGLPFDKSERNSWENLKIFSEKNHLHIWFTATIHRHEELTKKGLPVQVASFDEMFDDIVQLKTENKRIYIKSLKGNDEVGDTKGMGYFLDPSSMLVKKIN